MYAGIPRDYTGGNVTAKTLLAVLAGDKAALKGKGSGRVLEAGPNDRVFLFYSDHGSAGGVGRAACLGASSACHSACLCPACQPGVRCCVRAPPAPLLSQA